MGEPLVPPCAPALRALPSLPFGAEPAVLAVAQPLPLRGTPPAGRSPAPVAITRFFKEPEQSR